MTSADSGGSLAVLEVEIPPRTLVKPHNHTRKDEFTHVLAGTWASGPGTIVDDWIEELERTYGVKL